MGVVTVPVVICGEGLAADQIIIVLLACCQVGGLRLIP
jgi:hypothetical protein